MKQIQRVFALAVFASVLAGCASTGMDEKKESKPAAAPAAAMSSADAATKKDVEAAIAKESQFAGSKINVAAKDGEVTLTGEVKNDWLKYLAEDTAKKVKSVKSVKNSIKVPD
ncbi:BON domain-containing protein [uncultured Oxalicibacterium sp.]|uniref:BON domain-containing protein n=1 Tax=uncultured Oxalicibacterium sp. TaxID=1168540 RepID=UPI0025D95985|nr:BON domain-containing protein [uncultured Oxalicibacterium sp.]